MLRDKIIYVFKSNSRSEIHLIQIFGGHLVKYAFLVVDSCSTELSVSHVIRLDTSYAFISISRAEIYLE